MNTSESGPDKESTCCGGSRCKYKDPYFKKWADESTIHGVDHVFYGKSLIRRVLWGLVVLIAIGVMLYFIIDRIIYFGQRPTATTVKINLNENGISFPAVTICNLSPVTRSFADYHNITPFLEFMFFNGFTSFPPQFESTTCYTRLERHRNEPALNFTLRDIFYNGRHEVTNFVRGCYFGDFRNLSSCSNELQPVLTSSGLCYTFNNTRPVLTPGARFGLRMTVNISQDMYLSTDSFVNAGLRVTIHDHSALPEPDKFGIDIPPGRYSSIGLYPEETVSNPDISSCSPNTTNLEFFPGRLYTLSACQANEFYKRSAMRCNCTDIGSTPTNGQYSNLRNCTLADVCCLFDAYIYDQTSRSCLPSCNEVNYVSSISYSQYPSDLSTDEFQLVFNQSMDEIRSNLLSFNVFFGSIHTTQFVTELTYSGSALVADIGGQLALFIGASIISGIEIIALFFDEIKRFFLFSRRKTKKKVEEIEMESRKKEDTNNDTSSDKEEIVSSSKKTEV